MTRVGMGAKKSNANEDKEVKKLQKEIEGLKADNEKLSKELEILKSNK